MRAVDQNEPSDRKPDPWPLWMSGHAQLKCVMTECSKTQIRLTGPIGAVTWQNQQSEFAPSKERSAWALTQSSLSAWRKLWSLATHWAHIEDSDQTGRIFMLIWVFGGRTDTVGFVMSWLIFSRLHALFSNIWATSWKNLFLPYENNKGADQPAHPPLLFTA